MKTKVYKEIARKTGSSCCSRRWASLGHSFLGSFVGNSAELLSTHIEYTELIADVWESRCRSRSERCAELVEVAFQTGGASKEKLIKGLEGAFPASVLESASTNASVDPDGMVSGNNSLSVLDHENVALAEKVLGLDSDNETSDIQGLPAPQNTEIPGGRRTQAKEVTLSSTRRRVRFAKVRTRSENCVSEGME